jgi:acyl-CoA synthetase (AMP-forming)/AMP-acid ligase II
MISLTVNNRPVTVAAEPETPLLWVLREHLGLTGTKYGCGVAACGACTVHLDGEAVRACIVLQQDGLTEEQVRAHCKRFLTDYKVPRSVEFRAEMPKSPIGKILRKDLKAELTRRQAG